MTWLSIGWAAGGFRQVDLPHTTTFHFEWTSHGVSGEASFTFLAAVLREETALCSASAACLDGDFSTGNAGTGRFSTDLQVADCILRFADFRVDGSRIAVPARCELVQSLDLFYDGTSATYSGSAAFGAVTFERVFDCGAGADCPLDEDRDFAFAFAPSPFSGVLGGPGVGVFDER